MTVMAFQHLDWATPIGNALSAVLDGDNGKKLYTELSRERLLPHDAPRSGPRKGYGPAIVKAALDTGNLLRLTEHLESSATTRRDQIPIGRTETHSGQLYPNSCADLSSSFVRWHSVVCAIASEGGQLSVA
jgi:hypothetical protein